MLLVVAIQQGVSMGRRSEIEAEARKSRNVVTSVSVGGATAYIASGEIEVPPSAMVSQTSKGAPHACKPAAMRDQEVEAFIPGLVWRWPLAGRCNSSFRPRVPLPASAPCRNGLCQTALGGPRNQNLTVCNADTE